MNLSNKNKAKILLALMLSIFTLFPSNIIKATDLNTASRFTDMALSSKTFYDYNLAYAEIMSLPQSKSKNTLLNKLATITNIVLTPEIKKINASIGDLVKTKSAKTYDEIETMINYSTLSNTDRVYLASELASLGNRLVWSEDYKEAVDAVLLAWSQKTDDSIDYAKQAVSQVQNENNRQYLLNELFKLKSTM